jgi:hypothetical protein
MDTDPFFPPGQSLGRLTTSTRSPFYNDLPRRHLGRFYNERNDYHKANLTVLNLGPNAGTVMSSAHAMNELVRPASVILTHPNEAVTEGGKLRPASRAAALIKQLKGTAHLAISGRTMEFDGKGQCVAGC